MLVSKELLSKMLNGDTGEELFFFTERERENILHNMLLGEFSLVNGMASVPAWALQNKAVRGMWDRSPAEHLNAIKGLFSLAGFGVTKTPVTEEEAANAAKMCHEDVEDYARSLRMNFMDEYAESIAHTGHDRRFVDVVARVVMFGHVLPTDYSKGMVAHGEAMKKYISMYHDAWGM